MNRKISAVILTALVCMAFGLLTSCSSSSTPPPPPTITITAASGSGQTATVSTAFANPLVANVKTGGTATSGVSVTFTAPSSGASGTFSNGTNTITVNTDANGNATETFTANATASATAYTVTATTSGATTPASFSLTNSAAPVIAITAASGSGQSTTVSTAFANPLVANVTTGGTATANASVTFTAPAETGASGTFSNGTNTITVNTDANGNASETFTANANASATAYSVTATTTGASTPATFTLTNTAVPSANYVFYLSGLEAPNAGNGGFLSYYAVAGTVTINQLGQVVGGIEDYNDAFGITQTGVPISGGALSVDTSGQGTLTLNVPSNTGLGNPAGTEILGIQAVNISHILIVQFDGSATSSGSMDLQTTTSLPSAMGYAFTLSGVDNSGTAPVGYGGVFSLDSTGAISGIDDTNDSGVQALGATFSGNLTAPDAIYGRGQITGVTFGTGATAATFTLLNYYVVGPEVIRIIDLDAGGTQFAGGAAVGSAFGQGTTTTFTNASLPTSVFTLQANSVSPTYVAVGMLAPSAGTFTGGADYDFAGTIVNTASPGLAGTYSVSNTVGGTMYNGYGNVTITNASLGDVTSVGLYMTDPALNLLDPNNLSGLPTGGTLLLDLDSALSGGTGIGIPQTDTTAADFSGTYAFGGQNYNNGGVGGSGTFNEFDFVGLGSVTASTGAFAGTGLVSDPFAFFALTGAEIQAVPFAGTVTGTAGRYTMAPMTVSPSGDTAAPLAVVIYQANASQLLWMEDDTFAVFGGSLQTQGLLLPPAKAQAKHKH